MMYRRVSDNVVVGGGCWTDGRYPVSGAKRGGRQPVCLKQPTTTAMLRLIAQNPPVLATR